MAQINIPESVGRTLFNNYFNLDEDFWVVDTRDIDYEKKLKEVFKGKSSSDFVVKPDHIISKRGKQNLLGIKLKPSEVFEFIRKTKSKKVVDVNLTRFLIVPFVHHSLEFYISITTNEDGDDILFSTEGGVNIEENWEKLSKVHVGVLDDIAPSDVNTLLEGVKNKEEKKMLLNFIPDLLKFFREFDYAFLEINPLVVFNNKLVPLDFKGRLDDAGFFKLQKKLDIYSLLENVREESSKEEEYIRRLDQTTGASLKLTILNRDARIWPMISGGGASIIYFDLLSQEGFADDIGFYGEYSGNPSFELTYEYSKTIIGLMLASKAKNKILLIAGGNANFTDIVNTFMGIQKALEESVEEFKKQNIRILIRRGGPRVKEAFEKMQAFSDRLGLEVHMEGTSQPLSYILKYIS